MARFRIPGKRSGALHFWFMVLVIAGGGTYAYADHGPPPAETEHQRECSPVRWWPGETDPEGWRLLIDEGYTEAGDPLRLYPPGCEGAER